MKQQDMQKVGQGYAGGFTTVALSAERQSLIASVKAAGSDRDSLSRLLGDKLDNYFAWRMGGNSVLTTLTKIYNW